MPDYVNDFSDLLYGSIRLWLFRGISAQIYANQKAREAGDGIKPGAQAPGKSSLNMRAREAGDSSND